MPMPAFKKDPPTDPTIFDRLGISGALPDWLYDRSTLDKNFPVADPEASVLENTGNFLARIPWELPYAAADVVNAGERMLSRPVVSQDPVAVGDALMVAGAAPLGGVAARAATGAAIPDNAAGMFGGRLAKTADRMALANAERMVADGTPRDKIWNETGWFKGVDGKWRFEIDDSKSRVTDTVFDDIKSKGAHYGSLGTAMEHPSLFAAYPSAENVGATFHAKAKPIGNFHADSNSLEVAGPSTGAQRSIGLHEGQHWVQSKEGLARGSAPERELPNVRDEMDSRLAEFYQSSDRLMKANPEAAKLFREYNQATISKDFDKAIALEERLASMPEGQQLLENLFERSRIAVADVSELALDRYRQHAGEVEARAVQKRRSLTPEERRARPPWLDYDVPEAKQIVRFANPDDPTTGTVLDAIARATGMSKDQRMARQMEKQPGASTVDRTDLQRTIGHLRPYQRDSAADPRVTRRGRVADDLRFWGEEANNMAPELLGPVANNQRGFAPNVIKANPDDVTTGTVLDAVGRASNLPMDKASRMHRAKELGFDVDRRIYHGTVGEFPAFDKAKGGSATKAKSGRLATWLVDDPKTASGYADNAADQAVTRLIEKSQQAERRGDWDGAHKYMAQAERLEQEGVSGASVMPLHARGRFKDYDMDGAMYDPDDVNISDMLRQARTEGYDGASFSNFSDEAGYGAYNPATHFAVFDPKNIRSVNAAFDPAKKDSANLLAANPNDVTTGTLMDAIARQRAATELDRRLQEDGPERWS
jgi:hypothetical protein